MAINFKSVGDLVTHNKLKPRANHVPVGIATPLSLGQTNDGIFRMHFEPADQVHDNLKNLLLTNWGDRIAFYDFGANLSELTSEVSSGDFDAEAASRIKRAVSKWMPFVELELFDRRILGRRGDSNVTELVITITYSIPTLNVRKRSLDVVFHSIG